MASYNTNQYINRHECIPIESLNLHLFDNLNNSTYTVYEFKAGYKVTKRLLSSIDEDELNYDIICVCNKKNRQ